MFSAITMLFIVKFVLFNNKLLGHSGLSIFLKHLVHVVMLSLRYIDRDIF